MEEASGLIEAYDRLIADDLTPDTLDIVLGYLEKKDASQPPQKRIKIKTDQPLCRHSCPLWNPSKGARKKREA